MNRLQTNVVEEELGGKLATLACALASDPNVRQAVLTNKECRYELFRLYRERDSNKI